MVAVKGHCHWEECTRCPVAQWWTQTMSEPNSLLSLACSRAHRNCCVRQNKHESTSWTLGQVGPDSNEASKLGRAIGGENLRLRSDREAALAAAAARVCQLLSALLFSPPFGSIVPYSNEHPRPRLVCIPIISIVRNGCRCCCCS